MVEEVVVGIIEAKGCGLRTSSSCEGRYPDALRRGTRQLSHPDGTGIGVSILALAIVFTGFEFDDTVVAIAFARAGSSASHWDDAGDRRNYARRRRYRTAVSDRPST